VAFTPRTVRTVNWGKARSVSLAAKAPTTPTHPEERSIALRDGGCTQHTHTHTHTHTSPTHARAHALTVDGVSVDGRKVAEHETPPIRPLRELPAVLLGVRPGGKKSKKGGSTPHC
jgi:hypothetical protein